MRIQCGPAGGSGCGSGSCSDSASGADSGCCIAGASVADYSGSGCGSAPDVDSASGAYSGCCIAGSGSVKGPGVESVYCPCCHVSSEGLFVR